MPNFVRLPVGTSANFSAAANFTISATSSLVAGRTAAAGTLRSISYVASCAKSLATFAAPTISASREVTLGLMAEEVILCAGRAGQGQRADVNFAAAFLSGENFLGVQQALRVEDIAHCAHHVKIGFAEEQRHQAVFFHADPVFAGDGAAHFDAELDDFVGGSDYAAELRFVSGVEKD